MLGVFWNNFKKFRLAQSPLLGISGIRELNVLFIVRERLWRSLKSAILPQGVFHSQHQCGNFLLLESRILALESGVQLKEYEIPLTIAIWNPSGGGGTPRKIGWGCVRHISWNPYPISHQNLWFSLPYLRPDQKFDTLFQTWPLNQYTISHLPYNQIPRSNQC